MTERPLTLRSKQKYNTKNQNVKERIKELDRQIYNHHRRYILTLPLSASTLESAPFPRRWKTEESINSRADPNLRKTSWPNERRHKSRSELRGERRYQDRSEPEELPWASWPNWASVKSRANWANWPTWDARTELQDYSCRSWPGYAIHKERHQLMKRQKPKSSMLPYQRSM